MVQVKRTQSPRTRETWIKSLAVWPSAKLLTFSEPLCAHLCNEDINTSSSCLCQITDRIYMKVSGTEPDTLPSSPDLSLATFTSCLTPHQAQCLTHAELGFVAIWLAHMMAGHKGIKQEAVATISWGCYKGVFMMSNFLPSSGVALSSDS